jgi:ATP-binding cassette, subfamily F, member 2
MCCHLTDVISPSKNKIVSSQCTTEHLKLSYFASTKANSIPCPTLLLSVCTHMVNHTRKGLVYYSGNYDSFVNTREEKEGEQEKRFRLEQDQIKHMKDYVAKFGQGNAKMARQAQSKEKILDKMLKSGLTDKVEHEKALDFKFPDCGKISPPVLQCNDISFGYPGCEILYAGVDFGIDLDSRVALVGPNGAGTWT